MFSPSSATAFLKWSIASAPFASWYACTPKLSSAFALDDWVAAIETNKTIEHGSKRQNRWSFISRPPRPGTASAQDIGHHKGRVGHSNYLIAITRFSARSTWNLFPGGMIVVALYSAITAGPLSDCPGIR